MKEELQMVTEVRPFGVRCNIQCHYCYQNSVREAGESVPAYSLDLIKSGVERLGKPFALFGGEPLLMPFADLEDLLSWGFERFGRNSIQTNATLIADRHIEVFKRYNVSVGISIDGPGELNGLRSAGSPKRTSAATEKTTSAIRSLCQSGLVPSLIVTLHRLNATQDKLPMMNEWFRSLDGLGIRTTRLHILESDSMEVRLKYALTEEENLRAFLNFHDLETSLEGLSFDVFADIKKLLLAQDDKVACVWRACDPLSTPAVQGIDGNGQRTNCGRTNKEGVAYVKADSIGFERYVALFHTPQASGGCNNCRFFMMCRGQCPGTAIRGDWRLRSEYCDVWYGLFEHFEAIAVQDGETPISQRKDRIALEKALLSEWLAGRNPTLPQLLIMTPSRS
jgi:uncharacterized protein